jgi:signal transduction histidine kinase
MMVADSKRIVGIENKEAEECRRTGIENGFSALTTLCPLFSAAAYRVEYAGQGFSGGREACSFPLYTGLYRVREDGDLRVSLMTGTDDSSRIPPEIAKAGSDLLATIAIRFSWRRVGTERAEGTGIRELMRKMNSELSLAEERERKKIASDLHDHIEQALSMLRFRLAELRSNAVFCGFESCIEGWRPSSNKRSDILGDSR